MANTSDLQQAVVALGFQIDAKSLQRIEDAPNIMARGFDRLNSSMAQTGQWVGQMAEKLEAVYFGAQRVGASASNLRAFGAAAQDFGVSAQTAESSLKSLKQAMEDGTAADFLKESGLGVDTVDKTTGKLRDTVQVMGDVLAQVHALSPQDARRLAGNLGIDDELMDPKRAAQLLQRYREIRQAAATTGLDTVSADAHESMNSIREIGRTIDNISTKVAGAFLEKLKGPLQEFSQWFQTNGPLIGERMAEVAKAILDMALAVAPVLGWVAGAILELDAITGGWSTRIGLAIAAFRMLGGAELVTGLLQLAEAIGAVNLASGGLGAAGGLGGLLRFVGRKPLLGLGAAGVLTEGFLSLADLAQPSIPGESDEEHRARTVDHVTSVLSVPPPFLLSTKLAMDMMMLFYKPAAPGSGGVKVGPSSFSDLPRVPRPGFEGSTDPGESTQSASEAASGQAGADHLRMVEQADLAARAAGENFQRLLDGMPASSRGLLMASDSASLRLPAFGEPIPQSLSAPWDGYRSGALEVRLNVESPQVNLNATTHIYVEGAADPMATATAVAAQQDRVFADLTRNTQGAYQ
ncbi:hypothetical protein [Achromobacter sp. DH1f]|uniref:hypothetical protein n=1 Tax=Achromobacter sp. DH1f TaxID=1397275 RepID=UPI0004684379|nr:hypothetical protein [Achromobacter sp. DH1f]